MDRREQLESLKAKRVWECPKCHCRLPSRELMQAALRSSPTGNRGCKAAGPSRDTTTWTNTKLGKNPVQSITGVGFLRTQSRANHFPRRHTSTTLESRQAFAVGDVERLFFLATKPWATEAATVASSCIRNASPLGREAEVVAAPRYKGFR